MSTSRMPRMTPKQESSDSTAAESNKQTGGESLSELEQHITQRISRLADPKAPSSSLPISAFELEQALTDGDFLPPFEPVDAYDYQSLPRTHHNYGQAYEGYNSGYQGSGELLKGLQDLNDLLTESILNLNVRLTCLEDNLATGTEFNSQEIQKTLRDFKALLQETKQVSKLPQARTADEFKTSDLALELKQLDSHFERLTNVLKKSIDERHGFIANEIRSEFKVLQKLLKEDRETSQRHIFSLAVLLIVVIFIATAVVTHDIDRLSGFLTQQQDALQIQIEQVINSQKTKEPEEPLQKFPHNP